jgi:putative hydrolase of the HAD superfamily
MLRYLLFDLDNTLYPDSSGLWEAIGHRINLYMIEKLGMDPHEVTERRENYLNAFGTTLNALRHYYQVDAGEFLDFVHDLPLEKYLQYDQALDQMLGRLPLRKAIFTNADAPHAERVLSILGIAGHFERIIDIRALEFVNKPDFRAYEKALRLISADPEECIFVEDSLLNLLPAKKMGFLTVLVRDGDAAEGADCRIRRIVDLEQFVNDVLEVQARPAEGGTSGTRGELLF